MKNNLTTFYIIRHGQTDWNKNKMIQGQMDIPLNETGERQALEVAKKLKDVQFDLAFSSDLLRAKRTAEIIALEHKLAVETVNAIRERHFGELQGQPGTTLIEYIKTLRELSDEERKAHKIKPDIESDQEVINRVFTFLREIAVANPGKTVLIGTHGGVLRMILIHLGAMTYREMETRKITNGSYLVVESDGIEFFIKETSGLDERGYDPTEV